MKRKLIFAGLLVNLLMVGTAGAATWTVNVATDIAGDTICTVAHCSFRGALQNATTDTDANVIINFAPALMDQTINYTNTNSNIIGHTLADPRNVTINGLGADHLTINAAGLLNVLGVFNDGTFTLNDITLTGGNYSSPPAGKGGGGIIIVGSVTANLNRVVITGNTTTGNGGGVYCECLALNINDSTFTTNTANVGGGIYGNNSATTVKNSTFNGNTAAGAMGFGGGMTITGGRNSFIWNTTITGNTSVRGGGLFVNLASTPVTTLTIGNTVISGNSGSTAFPEIFYFGGMFATAGNNHIGDSAGDSAATGNSIAWLASDGLDTSPMLGSLTIGNGGHTPTRIPLPGSPLIDSGSNTIASNAGITRDQRGYVRVFGGTVDKGAVESGLGPTAADASLTGRVVSVTGNPVPGAEVMLTDQNGSTVRARTSPFGYFQFDQLNTGESYVLTASAKGVVFQPQLVTMNGTVSGFELIAQPSGR